MSSTESPVPTEVLRELFEAKLLPAAEQDQPARAFFPLGPDAGAETYYVERQRTTMSRDDFHLRTRDGGDDPIVALGERWQDQGLERLAALAPELRAIAAALRQTEAPADEVSPLIYVMF